MTTLTVARNGRTKMRASILAASQRLCVEHGEDALTIRNIAASVGVSPTIIYQHYHGKAEIMREMQLIGYDQLDTSMNEGDEGDPATRLAAMCRRYVRFAIDRPWMYELLFLRLVDGDDEHAEPPAFLRRLAACLRDGIASGAFRPELVPDPTAMQLWAAIHGMTTAVLDHGPRRGALAIAAPDRDDVLEGYLSLLLRGLAPARGT